MHHERKLIIVNKKLQRAKIGGCTFILGAILTGCGVPGLPDIVLALPETASQKACKQYGQAFSGTTREQITTDLEIALTTIRIAPEDDEFAPAIARAIDSVLTQTVVGTRASLITANNGVIIQCRAVDVILEME